MVRIKEKEALASRNLWIHHHLIDVRLEKVVLQVTPTRALIASIWCQ